MLDLDRRFTLTEVPELAVGASVHDLVTELA
jgi:hypothetical protein